MSSVFCASGQRGLRELSGGDFALVILDIGLPDMSGLRVLGICQPIRPPPSVLIITAAWDP